MDRTGSDDHWVTMGRTGSDDHPVLTMETSHLFELNRCEPGAAHSVVIHTIKTPGLHHLTQSFGFGSRNLGCTLFAHFSS